MTKIINKEFSFTLTFFLPPSLPYLPLSFLPSFLPPFLFPLFPSKIEASMMYGAPMNSKKAMKKEMEVNSTLQDPLPVAESGISCSPWGRVDQSL